MIGTSVPKIFLNHAHKLGNMISFVELLRLSMSSSYRLDSWFTYSILLLFLCTTGFWMARLNEGLSQFDAILIVPMFHILMEPCMLYCLRDKEEESQKAELQTEGDVMKAKTIQLRTSPKVLHATRLEESTEGIREIDWIRLPATY
ncbi:hypothetical protein LXL04_024436 [Taraxacum kok-saghyz]